MTSNLSALTSFFLCSFSKLVVFHSKILLVVSVLIHLENLTSGSRSLLLIRITGGSFKDRTETKREILTWAWHPTDSNSLILGEVLGFCVLKVRHNQLTNKCLGNSETHPGQGWTALDQVRVMIFAVYKRIKRPYCCLNWSKEIRILLLEGQWKMWRVSFFYKR